MDKTEYGIKLDQINSLVDKQNFQGALEIVESIDWRRVKSVRTLCMVGDIYEVSGKLEESKEILLLAYNRSSVGKAILYRLVEISLKLKQNDEAVEYYTEYVKNARGDNSKYILKYKIYKARRAPVEEQIAILEEYKSKEYTERWAYELAKLYNKAGQHNKCIEECDDLILWFSEGKYVVKAMELKMNYTPLTPSQQEKYRNRDAVAMEPEIAYEAVSAQTAQQTTDKLIEALDVMGTTAVTGMASDIGRLEAAVTSEDHLKINENASKSAYSEPVWENSENMQEKLAVSFRDVLSGINKTKDEMALVYGRNENTEEEASDEPEDMSEYNVVKDLEPEKPAGVSLVSQEEPSSGTIVVPEEAEQIKEKQPEEEMDVDIAKILEETANNLARQIGKGEYTKEESKEEPIEEPLPVQEMTLTDVGDTQEFDLVEQLSLTQDTSEVPEETTDEKRLRVLKDTRPQKLSDEQKQLFTYFAKVPGMDQQLLDAMNGVYSYAGDKTSKHGNIVIMGKSGTGKTRLSDGLIKAICKDLGLEAVKVARLNGEDLNKKDPVKVVGKMAGGFLLIEKAASMNEETIDRLSHALEFRTDSLILMIEDEKSNMRSLLAEHEAFAKKFETIISIPAFTNDELVTFARTYAKEMGYRMDEMGVLALYTLIGDNQTEAEPVTVGWVKELVDNAIQRAQKVTRKFGRKLAVRNTDEEGRVILYEKDFDLRG